MLNVKLYVNGSLIRHSEVNEKSPIFTQFSHVIFHMIPIISLILNLSKEKNNSQ